MPLGLVVTARVRVPTTTARVTARRTTRMSATTGVRMPATRDVRVPTAEVTARMLGASTRIPVRSATTGGARMATTRVRVVARYRMPTAGRAVTFGSGATMTSRRRATMIFRSMSARATVMRYIVRGTPVRAASMRGNNASSGELTRSRRSGHRRSAVVKGRAQLSITRSGMLMITLQRRGFEMMLMFRGKLMRSRTRLDTTGAVERHVVDVVDDGPVIHVGDVDTAHVHGRAVVEKGTTAPVTALESNTAIAEAVVHAAVEADMRTPVAPVPGVDATTPTPVARRPQQSGRRRQHPGTGHPVITVIAVSPISGRPHIAGSGKRRLYIHRQHRGRYVYRYTYRDTGV